MEKKLRTSGLSLSITIALLVPLLMAAPVGAAGAGTGASSGKASVAAAQTPLREIPRRTYHMDFEKTIQPWSAGTNDHSMVAKVAQQKGDNGCDDGGKAYAALQSYTPDPTGPSGTAGGPSPLPIATWANAAFAAPAGPVDVTVQWAARNLALCDGCQLAVYVGSVKLPQSTPLQPVGTGLTKQWQSVSYQSTLLYGNTGTVYVAIGWLGSGASIALDCITVNISSHYDYNYGFDSTNELASWQTITLGGDVSELERNQGDAGCSNQDLAWHASLLNFTSPGGLKSGDNQAKPPVTSRLIEATFPSSGDQFTNVQVSLMSRDEYGCADCTPLIYIGTTPLTQPSQLQQLNGRFGNQWQALKYQTVLPTWGTEQIYVAVGWRDPLGGPESPRSVGYDCMNIHIEPSDVLP